MAWFCSGCFRYRISRCKNRVVCDDDDVESQIGSNVKRFSWDEVRLCTNGFEKVIDSGGYSVVYYGNLTLKQPVVNGAFKVHSSSERLNQGFKEELGILLQLNHPNIVKLYGYSDDQDAERGALVFEYVPNGTLHQNLHSNSDCSLPWRKRTMLAYQLALALEYLHERCELHIVHGDIKSSNILLDSNHNLKLCDFGSAKMGFSSAIKPSRKQLISGSPGYVDPHYLRTGIASKKNDIYSFGVVVMELITGQEAFNKETGRMLTTLFSNESGHVDPGLMDPRFGGEFDLEEARVMSDFLKEHWNIAKWVALGAVILEALVFLLALIVRAANRPDDYDSDDEFINPRQSARQPLIRPAPPATGVPVAGALDQRPSRNDAWSTRMREKYGLDTSEFTYNPAEAGRFQPVSAQPAEERGRCTIM